MFQYEDLDFETLRDSEEIDPDSPEALYAMAQFYRTGKGVTADADMYKKYLRSAAQAGSEMAARELEEQKGTPTAPKTAQAPSSLTELIRGAEKGQPDALIPAADACARMGEPERAVRFLQKAADLIDRNIYTEEECQQIWLKLARLWGSKELNNPEECHRAYGMAAELHNAEAAAAYAEQCRNGYGCEKDEEKALHYEAISAERGGPMEKYGFALQLMTTGKRMDAAMLMEQAMNTAQDPETKQACRLLMAYLGAAPLTPETAQWAWQHYDGQKIQVNPVEDGKREEMGIPLLALAEPYGTMEHAREAGLPFDARQAALIGKNTDPAVGIEWMEYAAEQGDTGIYNALGYYYVVGKGVPKDPRRAFSWFEKGAQAGDATAQYNMGLCYWDGNGVPADPGKAAIWFRQAADKGDASAQNRLGHCYQNGIGVAADPEQAVYWYNQAAKQGDGNAQSNLGICYRDGIGVAADPEKMIYWFRQAAEQGNAKSQNSLGNCYLEGRGVERDPVQAAAWFRKAAIQGWATAQYNLGGCYKEGVGVAKNLQKAAEWFRKAAEQGMPDAQYVLGKSYASGSGVEKDLTQAAAWYQKAAEQGMAEAQYSLSVCYREGSGVAADLKKSAFWSRKAAEQGMADAQNDLGVWYQRGVGVEGKDLPQAAEWFRKAAEQGLAEAQCNLGLAYWKGQGVEQDEDQALIWLQKAADQGYEQAGKAIQQMRRQQEPEPAQLEQPSAASPSNGKNEGLNNRKLLLPLLVAVAFAVVWMVSGFVEVLFPAKSDAEAGTAGTGTSQAADSNVINPFDPAFFNTPDGVELKFSGIAPNGTLIISNNLPSDNPASQIIYEADRYEGFSDLDNVTITASLDNSDYRLKNFSTVIKVHLDNHYLESLDELNADTWAKIKTALNEMVLANIGTPDENGVYGENRNRKIREGEGYSLSNSRLYNLSYKTCVLLNAKKPEDLDSDDLICRLMVEYTVDYDFLTATLLGDPYTAIGATGCIYVDNLIVDGDGNAEVDSTQFSMGKTVYPDSVDFENEWISPYMTTYSMSTVDASQVLPQ